MNAPVLARAITEDIAVVILAKDEAATIACCLGDILNQDLFRRLAGRCTIHVVANGCTDDTADRATRFLREQALPQNVAYDVVDIREPGKSRAWNIAVHTLVDERCAFVYFVDSDIALRDDTVLAGMIDALLTMPDKAAYVGLPVKNNERAQERSITDRFSSGVSKKTRALGTINGSLYVIRAEVLRQIWLPNETPGEDGFLNAMVETRGFTVPDGPSLVVQSAEPTHFFDDVGPRGFFAHERRMMIGTAINNWLFEHLWSLRRTTHVGEHIKTLNATQPDWVQDEITRRAGRHWWVMPSNVAFSRFGTVSKLGVARWAGRFPFAFAATVLSLPSIVAANRLLRRRGAARHW